MPRTESLLTAFSGARRRVLAHLRWMPLILLLGLGALPSRACPDEEDDPPPGPLPPGAVARVGGRPRKDDPRSRPVHAVAFNRRGELLVCSLTPPTFSVWNAATGRDLIRPRPLADRLIGIEICASETGDVWAVRPDGPEVHLWRRGQARIIKAPESKDETAATTALSSDGSRLAFSRQHLGKLFVSVYDTACGRLTREFQTEDPVRFIFSFKLPLVFSPNGKTVVSARHDASLVAWDVATGKVLRRLCGYDTPLTALAVAPGGRLLASLAREASREELIRPRGSLRLWDLPSGRALLTIPLPEPVGFSLCFSPDGFFLTSAGPYDSIRLWEVLSGQEVCRWTEKGSGVYAQIFAPDGRSLATSGLSKRATLWNLAPLGWKPPQRLSESDLRRLWDDLARAKAPQAYKAMWSLAAFPARAVALLQKGLHPIPAENPARIRALVADLDHDTFRRRDEAARVLAQLGPQAEAELRRVLADQKTSVEARSRIEPLLKGLERWVVTEPEMRGALRGIWVLERIGSKDAQQVLKRLADGAPAARQTRAAKAALQRLDRRGSPR